MDDDRWQQRTRWRRPGGGPALAALPAPPQNHKRELASSFAHMRDELFSRETEELFSTTTKKLITIEIKA